MTFQWWNDVWFTEGFTTYFTDVIVKAASDQKFVFRSQFLFYFLIFLIEID